MKDPAFLFYTKDFQSGTQDMSCDEVGAYLRLLMYQHQHGNIPVDKERLMRITSIFTIEKFDMVWEMVGNKFNQIGNHLVNNRLDKEINQRSINKPKKTAAASLAGLISSSKLSKDDQVRIKRNFKMDLFIYENDVLITDETLIKTRVREWFNTQLNNQKETVNQMVNNYANGDGDVNENVSVNKEKEGTGEKIKKSIVKTSEIVFPFETELFKTQWQLWKAYKAKEFGFKYKSESSEQAGLSELNNLSGSDEKKAIAIIHQSLAKGWKGFFELKNNQNERSNSYTGQLKTVSDSFARKIAEGLQSE
ncbi:DUF1376 domain-containing protein [Flavobacterium kingsejongi]|uniref:DUF1376 domain-containing protein n=1 Tax=Flavobacterium kingsejongi TaxID=1678728 RepID=A0A2S1LQT0_9FLAO|nr:DUF1376 domain-containing protein [Flavobacterium kingsejongi]AWG26022.1 hypothetical protein FK004_12700 [Flavobacterium kingsejongi]